ncbi:MAG: DUF1840 domain-containing protein [Rhodocyclaceae bacterium]|nr:DUF1840 domain-containing protein [Rhodocyclaceae bacterium]
MGMMVKFHSLAAGEILMFGDVARRMMELMGKEPIKRGVVTVGQLPGAIARLKAAIAEDKARHADQRDEDLPADEADGNGSRRPYVNLARRALPLVELLERSLEREKPVLWGNPGEP